MPALVKFYDNDGATQLTEEVLSDVLAGVTQTPRKMAFENVSDRPLPVQLIIQVVTGNDGSTMVRTAQDTTTVGKPYGAGTLGAPTASLSVPGAGGVWSGTGIRGYKVTATNALGETFGSVEVTVNVDDTTKTVTVAWTQTPGATGYKVYRTDTPGTYGATTLRATIGSGATISYVDDGGATSSGTPSLINTTAGWALGVVLSAPGAGGVWSGTGTRYWSVTAHDATGTIIAQTFEGSVNVDDVTKKVTLTWAAVAAAVNFKVWRTTVSGNYASPALVTTLSAGATTYDDTGTVTTSGALTTLASYGIPPASFGTGAISYGTLAIGQQVFGWFNRVVPGGTPELGNPRIAQLVVKEV